MTDHQPLAQKFTLPNGTVLPNRIAKAAMSEQLARRDGAPSQTMINLYRAWSRGGAGLLITGNVMIDRRAFTEPRNVAIEDDRHHDMLTHWAKASKTGGAVTLVQLSHPGRLAIAPLWPPRVAPSAIRPPVILYNLRRPHALTLDGIAHIRRRFVRAAQHAVAAGFDGVQVHAAHGYLLSQFLTPSSNLRTDNYGGTPANRRRLLLEIVTDLRHALGTNAPISVKLNSADFHRGGLTEQESLDIALALADTGVDLLEISGGNYESPAMFGDTSSSTAKREAYFLHYAEQLRQRTAMPLMLTGGFRTRAAMESALTSGAVDIIGLARPLAIHPDLPSRLLAGHDTPPLPQPPRRDSPWLAIANSYLQLAWHGAYFRNIAAGSTKPVSVTYRGALTRAITRTALLAATQ